MEPFQMREAVAEANRAKQFAEKRLEQYSNEVNEMKALLGIKVRAGGAISIDFEKFTETLGPEQCLFLRDVIDGKVKGAETVVPQPKRRISVTAEARHV